MDQSKSPMYSYDVEAANRPGGIFCIANIPSTTRDNTSYTVSLCNDGKMTCECDWFKRNWGNTTPDSDLWRCKCKDKNGVHAGKDKDLHYCSHVMLMQTNWYNRVTELMNFTGGLLAHDDIVKDRA